MKSLFFLVALWFVPALVADNIVVYAKGEFAVLNPGVTTSAPKDPVKARFLATVQADLLHPTPFAPAVKLLAPPEWGKTVPGAGGTLEYHDKFSGGFFVRVSLEGLTPNHRYILTLNGNPKLAGNERLVDAVPGLETERYFDFLTITTDDKGRYAATFGIALSAGPYDVRFYVKDTTDFKIVLYRDYFKFTVK